MGDIHSWNDSWIYYVRGFFLEWRTKTLNVCHACISKIQNEKSESKAFQYRVYMLIARDVAGMLECFPSKDQQLLR